MTLDRTLCFTHDFRDVFVLCNFKLEKLFVYMLQSVNDDCLLICAHVKVSTAGYV